MDDAFILSPVQINQTAPAPARLKSAATIRIELVCKRIFWRLLVRRVSALAIARSRSLII